MRGGGEEVCVCVCVYSNVTLELCDKVLVSFFVRKVNLSTDFVVFEGTLLISYRSLCVVFPGFWFSTLI